MILLRQLILILIIIQSAVVCGCSCVGGPLSFSLNEYDRVYDVVEVSFFAIEELGTSPRDFRRERMQYDSLKRIYEASGRQVVPPPPPPPPWREILVGGVVEQSFKGRIRQDTTWFVTNRDGGSCGWRPQIGTQYLIYLGKPREVKGEIVFGLGLCQRKFAKRKGTVLQFKQERKILRALRNGKNGRIKKRQLLFTQTDKIKFLPFIGGFWQGKRHGVWVIYLPVESWRKMHEAEQPLFSITYNQGKVQSVVVSERLSSDAKHHYFRWADEYKLR